MSSVHSGCFANFWRVTARISTNGDWGSQNFKPTFDFWWGIQGAKSSVFRDKSEIWPTKMISFHIKENVG